MANEQARVISQAESQSRAVLAQLDQDAEEERRKIVSGSSTDVFS